MEVLFVRIGTVGSFYLYRMWDSGKGSGNWEVFYFFKRWVGFFVFFFFSFFCEFIVVTLFLIF